MGLRYRIPLPGPFYYSGRAGPKHWLPHGSHAGTGPMGFVVKWLIAYPSVFIFGAGLAIVLAPFYGLFWGVRCSLRRRQRCQLVARCVPVQWPLPQRPALSSVSRPYGFVPARIGVCELGCPFLVSSVGLVSCPPFRDRTWRRTRPYVPHHPMFWGVMG